MMNSLRNAASTWVAKILFGLLVLSFGAWGVGDWTRGFSREKLAEVGGREITETEFQRAYQAQLNMISSQLHRQVTSAEARNYGLTQRVLQTLVGAAAVNIHADKLNLGISDKAIADNIRNEESFAGEDGKFSPGQFQQVLNANGMTEPMFVDMQRREIVRSQLVGTLTAAPVAPRTLVEALNHYRNDERVLKYFILPPEAAGTVDKPGEDVLKAYYEEHKRNFMSPEFRRAGILLLSPEKLKQTASISDADLKAAYEVNKKAYTVPERRTIQQLVFKDMAAAHDASHKLAAGADFAQLGKDLGLTDGDVNLGQFTKDGFADKKVAEVAFQLEKNKPSEPISGFSPVIVRVTDIVPGTEKSFDEVKDQVREGLLKTRASEEISQLHDKIEDERAGGSTLSEIGQKLNLEYKDVTINRQGIDREGKRLELPGQAQDVAKLIFETDVGVENNPVSLGDESFAFVDVQEVQPERQRPFEEVREDVAKNWIEEETRNRLAKKADEIIAALGKGQSMEDAAGAAHASVKTTQPLRRTGVEPGLPVSAITQAFSLPEGGFASAQSADRKGRAIFQVATIKAAPTLDEKGFEQLSTEIGRSIGNDIFAQYVNGLQTAYGVQINAKAISNATTGGGGGFDD
jgi:peptidyl-prolyl cis-trans isomerase D